MSQKGQLPESAFHAVLGRALSDIDYRKRLVSDDLKTRRAAFREGIGADPTDAQMSALNESINGLNQFGEQFNQGPADS